MERKADGRIEKKKEENKKKEAETKKRKEYGDRKKKERDDRSGEGFPGGAVVENLPANAGDTGSSPGLGRSHMPRNN